MPLDLPSSPAAQRNRAPILAALRPVLAEQGRALEIASGSGEHVAHFAAGLPGWHWQPTDAHSQLFGAIQTRCNELPNVATPARLDVLNAAWPSDGPAFGAPFDLVYCANMLHIAPWACTPALMQGAARHLRPGGWLITYGPYLEDEVATAPSNLAFDADLRAHQPEWGIRRRADVNTEATRAGLVPALRVALPANNLLLGFRQP